MNAPVVATVKRAVLAWALASTFSLHQGETWNGTRITTADGREPARIVERRQHGWTVLAVATWVALMFAARAQSHHGRGP